MKKEVLKKLIQEKLDKGRNRRLKIDEMALKYTYPKTRRGILLLGYFSIIVEHHEGLFLLIQNKLYGPAYALLRTMYEPLHRALWVNECATDSQIDKIIDDKFKDENIFPRMDIMVDAIDNAYKTGSFYRQTKDNLWNIMNDWTHSGLRQLARQFAGNVVVPNYDLDEVFEVLKFAEAYILLMALFFFYIHKKTEEIKAIQQMMVDSVGDKKE